MVWTSYIRAALKSCPPRSKHPLILFFRIVLLTELSSSLRSTIIALASTGILPSIETFGIVVVNTSAAVLAWIGLLYVLVASSRRPNLPNSAPRLLLITIRYGDRMRSWTDIEWSTPKDN
jgi:hypothetical protein